MQNITKSCKKQNNSIIMKPFLLLLLTFLIHLSISQGSYCSNFYTPLFSSCTFYYTFSDPACQDFQFIKCTWQECAEQQTVNNHTSCKRYQTKYDSSWNYCTTSCCLKYYPYAYESLQQCSEDLKELYGTIALVLLIIVGVLLLIFAIFVAIKFIGRKTKSMWQSMAGCRQSCLNILTCKCLRVVGRHHSQQLADERQVGNAINWVVVQDRSEEQNKICGACYQSGCTIRLECQHLFHRQCGRDFMRYGGQCVTCKNKCTSYIRIYCEQCKKSYFVSKVDQYYQMNPHLCPKCDGSIQ